MVRSLEQCSILALVGFGCLCWATRIHLEEMQDISNWRCKDLLPYGCGVVCKVIAAFEHKSWRFSSFQVRITFLFHPFAFAVFWAQILPGLSFYPFFPLACRWSTNQGCPNQTSHGGILSKIYQYSGIVTIHWDSTLKPRNREAWIASMFENTWTGFMC